MKALLMYRDRDFDLRQVPMWNEQAIVKDLEVGILTMAMAGTHEVLREVAQKALLGGFHNSVGTILYRQGILRDCLRNPEPIRELYALTVETIEGSRKHWWGISAHTPDLLLYDSIGLLEMFASKLAKLRKISEEHASHFQSEGMTRLFAMFSRELTDEYLAAVANQLSDLRFPKGVLASAELGTVNQCVNYELRKPNPSGLSWLDRLLRKGPPAYTFHLAERDEAGAQIMANMRGRAISRVACAVGQSADHVLGFFKMLRTELAFYIGCLNLHERLRAIGESICFPEPLPAAGRALRFSGLYDVALSLQKGSRIVGNSLDAGGKNLVVITGPNQGGKSTFLRSVGLAQLMMQCGMFVGADLFSAEICPALFTHFKREEDTTMKSGKLDEELSRIDEIVRRVEPNSILLLNESFAATNDREGSEIAGQIVCALFEAGIKILYVTHLREFARRFFEMRRSIFLRAERLPDGSRTFKIVGGSRWRPATEWTCTSKSSQGKGAPSLRFIRNSHLGKSLTESYLFLLRSNALTVELI